MKSDVNTYRKLSVALPSKSDFFFFNIENEYSWQLNHLSWILSPIGCPICHSPSTHLWGACPKPSWYCGKY